MIKFLIWDFKLNIMKIIRNILVLSFLLIVCAVIADDNSKQSVLTSNELIEKMRKAIDSDGKLAKADTKFTEGELIMPAQKIRASVKTFFRKPCKFVAETHFPDGTIEKGGYDGKTVWKKTFNSKKSVEIKGIDKNSFILSSYLESPDINVWYDVFSNIQLDNKLQKIDGISCYKLTCSPKAYFGIDAPVVFFINCKNFLIKRMDISLYSNGKEFRQKVLVAEYKNFDGIMVPSKTKTDVMGAEIDYNITNFKLNKKLDDKLFVMQE